MRLGIVGHGAEKFTPASAAHTRRRMVEIADELGATAIVSGRSPMGGVDIWAEELAESRGLAPIIHPATRNAWDGPGGYKERNLLIVRDSDLVLCMVVASLPPGFIGMAFSRCYHCKGRNPEHVKSGGCWTAWRCAQRRWEIIPA